jgi:hypothetical protein
MKNRWYAALCGMLLLSFASVAQAQQVDQPMNAPASVTSGHGLCATATNHQAADCGFAPISAATVAANYCALAGCTFGTSGTETFPDLSTWSNAGVSVAGSISSFSVGTGEVLVAAVSEISSFAVAYGNKYDIDCSSAAITATLPAAPTAGQINSFKDVNGCAATHNITIALNGKKLDGSSTNPVLSINGSWLKIRYTTSVGTGTAQWVQDPGI